MNLLTRLQSFDEDLDIESRDLMRYRMESIELSRIINETKKKDGYCTQLKLNGILQEWLSRTGYMQAEGLERLRKLGYTPSSKALKKGLKHRSWTGRTDLGALIMNTYRVGLGGRKLPGISETITIEYDSDGDSRWSNFSAALSFVQAEYDIWYLLETIASPAAMLGLICTDNPSPPMRAILEKERAQE